MFRGDRLEARRGRGVQPRHHEHEEAHGRRNRGVPRAGHHRAGGRHPGGRHGGAETRKVYPMSTRKLQEIVAKEPSDVLLDLMNNPGFEELVKKHDTRDASTGLVFRALVRASQSTSRALVMRLLTKIALQETFLLLTLKYLGSLQSHAFGCQEAASGFGTVVALLRVLSDMAPHYMRKNIVVLLPNVEAALRALEERKVDVERGIRESIQELTRIRESSFMAADTSVAANRDESPPNDFRDIPIIPDVEDILADGRPFLRSNVVRGRYADVQHYLDVQFRLLREDLVRPLRHGVQEFLGLQSKGGPVDKLKDVRIYFDVRIAGCICTDVGLAHCVTFDRSKLRKVKWETSKRFLTGSLLLLSPDNFRTLIFATVARRDARMLSEGQLPVTFCSLEQVTDVGQDVAFVMIESCAYFEAYKYNLAALQQLTSDTLPLQRYIVEVDPDSRPPRYLEQGTSYDLKPITKDGASFQTRDLLNENTWPSLHAVSLDEAQFRAIHAALTREFCIIQGPPGTGKTFVGLGVIKVLLHNMNVWYKGSPILVVCYTNHALDQFLEGITQFTRRVVRVGGRCSNEQLSSYQLSQQRRALQERRDVPRNLYANAKAVRMDLEVTKAQLQEQQTMLQRATDSILCLSDLAEVMNPYCYESLSMHHGGSIPEWLDLSASPKFESAEAAQSNDADDDDESEGEEDLDFLEGMREIDGVDDLGWFPQVQEAPAFGPNVPQEEGWKVQGGKKQLQKHLKYLLRPDRDVMTEAEASVIANVWTLSHNDRWKLYRYWVQQYVHAMTLRLQALQQEFYQKMEEQKELRNAQDLLVVRSAHIVGMTTTGAAKYRSLLRELGPPIVVVEEAAELLESHVVTSLSPATEHLVLIGDHQQLRPSPTVYALAKHFKLDISLFERMVVNGMHCTKLQCQHRMRPDFVQLLVPHIYESLSSHASVQKYENVVGVSRNLFFVNHGHQESGVEDGKSRCNRHEAEFLTKLCKYLVLQGYTPSQVTVLTTYSGQMFLLKRLMKQEELSGVRVTVVDNFQGEENDIILLSFVRSNIEGKVGFLKIENRVCVALSRARKGLFAVGNFELMAESGSLWKNITSTLHSMGAIGTALILQCQRHRERMTSVSCASDFHKVPEGGCNLPCNARLSCGHACSRICHVYDAQHEKIQCNRQCERAICERNHKCPLKCHEKCLPCRVPVVKTMPDCGHDVHVPCSVPAEDFVCPALCRKLLPCSHKCKRKCGLPCTTLCKVVVTVRSDCGHKVNVSCDDSRDPTKVMHSCREPCRSALTCEHQCIGTCGSCFQGRLHKRCSERCGRVLVCGHECKEPCAKNCPPCKQECGNECQHSRCTQKCGIPCVPCTEECLWTCPHAKCSKRCHEPCLRPPCDEPCKKALPCGHPCVGFCGEICPRLCRVCHNQELTAIFFGTEEEEDARFVQLEDCGHVVEESGLTTWMHQPSSGVQMKCCPVCKTPIRKSLRYGNVVKQCIRDIEKVKRKMSGSVDDDKKRELQSRVTGLQTRHTLGILKERLLERLETRRTDTAQALVGYENYVNFLQDLCSVDTYRFDAVELPPEYGASSVARLYETLSSFMLDNLESPTQQQLEDIGKDVYRFKLLGSLLDLDSKYRSSKNAKFSACLQEALGIVSSPARFEDEKRVKDLLREAQKTLGSTVINVTEHEKREILQAMRLNVGHWFQCPNGHVYCITECGGAMEEGKCNECGAQIGGRNHALRGDNRVAREMDGAPYAAYSDMNNLANYGRFAF